jgi:hypothetical protein
VANFRKSLSKTQIDNIKKQNKINKKFTDKK